MGTIVLSGTGDTVFTIGMGEDKKSGEVMPFMAFGRSDLISGATGLVTDGKEHVGAERTTSILNAFDEHGTVVFFDNFEMAATVLQRINELMQHAVDTSWILRTPEKPTIN